VADPKLPGNGRLQHCSNVLKKISTTFQNLDERQQRLEGNETVPLIIPILTNIETQLSQYDILAAVFHVSAVQTTQIAMPYRDQWNDHCRGHLSSITSKRCGSIAPAVYRRGGRSIPISLKRKDVYRIIAEVFLATRALPIGKRSRFDDQILCRMRPFKNGRYTA
jgi:hypothetical protein